MTELLQTVPHFVNDFILILAPKDDIHARAVATVLERDFSVNPIIWDSAAFPSKDSLSLSLAPNGVAGEIHLSRGYTIAVASLRSIWWRRFGPYHIDQSVTDHDVRRFCSRECDSSFKGTLEALNVPIVNSIASQTSASRKPLQLATAKSLGIPIPRTLISNNPDEVRQFWYALDRNCIYKSFTPPDWKMAETRMLYEEDFANIQQLRHAPIIVQEKIDKGRDVRVSIFGESVFAAEVTTHRVEAELDWRLDLTATWHEHALPTALSGQLVKLLRSLGLDYGCIDLRQRPDGEYIFFEVNPAGQFLFVEVDTGLPLSNAMATLLSRPNFCNASYA
jgi:glutathione synthase/RimK-type ligase-like ATP-grasp enzyme